MLYHLSVKDGFRDSESTYFDIVYARLDGDMVHHHLG